MATRGTQAVINTAAATTVVFTYASMTPAAPQVGDVCTVLIIAGGNTTTITPPSGYTAIPGTTSIATASGALLKVYSHVYGSSEPSTVTFTCNQSDFHSGEIRANSGRNTSSPFTAVSQTGPTTS